MPRLDGRGDKDDGGSFHMRLVQIRMSREMSHFHASDIYVECLVNECAQEINDFNSSEQSISKYIQTDPVYLCFIRVLCKKVSSFFGLVQTWIPRSIDDKMRSSLPS